MDKFKQLGLSENLCKGLKAMHITEPTEIQEKAIPLVVAGKDVVGGSATGSGKTLAFAAGMLQRLKSGEKNIQALIMTPTRELAEQIATSIKKFAKFAPANVAVVYGGVAIEPQMQAVKKAQIVVGTPGRILDHLQRDTINLKHIDYLVLDEADRMLEMGFIEDVDKIISQCDKNRQTLLFSATISPDIEHLTKKYLKNPETINVESYVDPSKLKQVFYDVPPHLKFSLLYHLLKNEKAGLTMVFCNTRINADMVVQNLKRYEIDAIAIHGGHAQAKRENIMKMFHANTVKVMVCTDVAARGLDIKGVSHVYNYDIPKTSTEYIHRIGRTARAGEEGMAINILSSRDYDNFNKVLEDKSLKIEQLDLPYLKSLDINFQRRDDRRGRSSGGRSGGRSSGGRFGNRPRGNNRERPQKPRSNNRRPRR